MVVSIERFHCILYLLHCTHNTVDRCAELLQWVCLSNAALAKRRHTVHVSHRYQPPLCYGGPYTYIPVVLHESLVVFEHESNDKEEMLNDGEFVTGHGGELSKELP